MYIYNQIRSDIKHLNCPKSALFWIEMSCNTLVSFDWKCINCRLPRILNSPWYAINGMRMTYATAGAANISVQSHRRLLNFQSCQNIKIYNIQFAKRSSEILHLRWTGREGWIALRTNWGILEPLSTLTRRDAKRDKHKKLYSRSQIGHRHVV